MANVYNVTKKKFVDGALNAGTADFRCLLLQSSGPPSFDADQATVAAVLAATNNTEVSVAGYSRQALAGEATSQDDANDRAEVSATKATFASLASGQTIGAAVVFVFVTTDADSFPVAYYELTDTATNGGDIEIRWDGLDPTGDFLRLTE